MSIIGIRIKLDRVIDAYITRTRFSERAREKERGRETLPVEIGEGDCIGF